MHASTPDPRARAIAKSATAFRTISEVSTELDVPQHVLRFWETKFPQIRPLKRGGGRRYYRPEDVELLRRIQQLLYREGYTIKGVQRLLREARGGTPAEPEGVTEPDLPDTDDADLPPEYIEAEPEPEPEPAHLTADQREDLEEVLAELVALRDMLRGEFG
jgi:DNA-binding transcriptional MerR regulator